MHTNAHSGECLILARPGPCFTVLAVLLRFMKRNIVPLLGIAFVVAIAATGIFYGLFVGKIKDATANSAKSNVVVAARAIPSGTMLKAADVKLTPWAGSEPIKGGFPTVEEVVGKTVFTSVDESEPVTQARLASRTSSGGVNIAQGMRAISVTVSESSGILTMLRPGHRVDLQAVVNQQSGEPRIRTILQDIEVLTIHPPEQLPGRAPTGPVVTLLVKPNEADQLALADSAVKIRLLLRNPTDREKGARPALVMANVFQEYQSSRQPVMQQAAARPAEQQQPASADLPRKLNLLVRIVGAAPRAMEELSSKFAFPRHPEWMQVSTLASTALADQYIARLEGQNALEVFTMTRLTTGNNREVSMQAGSNWNTAAGGAYGLRIQFLPTWNQSGTLRMRVQPEITSPGSTASSSRKFESEVELSEGQSFVVTGLGTGTETPSLVERLFAGRVKQPLNRELFVVVTPQVMQPMQTVARHGTAE